MSSRAVALQMAAFLILVGCNLGYELLVKIEDNSVTLAIAPNAEVPPCIEVLNIYEMTESRDVADASRIWRLQKLPGATCVKHITYPIVPEGYRQSGQISPIFKGRPYRAEGLVGAGTARADFKVPRTIMPDRPELR